MSPGFISAMNTRLVGLAARVRLHVGEAAVEQLLGAVDGELLGHVDVLAAAVVALAGIAFRILVGEHACRPPRARPGETMFSDAISSISSCWRSSSRPTMPASSGSLSASVAEKKREVSVDMGVSSF